MLLEIVDGRVADALESIVNTALLVLAMAVLFYLGKWREAAYQTARKRVVKKAELAARSADGALAIDRQLYALQRKFDAMRVVVFQFHNGESFLLSNHAWKFTCTHEALRAETVPRMQDNQSLLSSGFSDMLVPLLSDRPFDIAGVKQLEICSEKCGICKHGKHGHRVVHYVTHEMDVSIAQVRANAQGIHHTFAVNLLDPDRHVTIGFLALHFGELDEADLVKVRDSICDICPVAETIQIFLTSEFAAFRRAKKPWWGFLFPN